MRIKMSKIVSRDNYNRETESERFVLWPMPEESAKKIVEVLNKDAGDHLGSRFYSVVDNDYELYKFEI